jgi:hypothetical protein
MFRYYLLAGCLALVGPQIARADTFDYYTNELLAKLAASDSAVPIKELTPDLVVEHNRVLTDVKGAFVVVKTNDGRWCRLLVQASAQKIGGRTLPILLIDRYVTYKEGEERTIVAEGKNLRLFAEFQLNLDLGQIVPGSVGGDIRLVVAEEKTFVEPIGKAEIFLVKKPLAEAAPKKGDKVIVGPVFEQKYLSGTYKLYDDGRRVGKLVLAIAGDGFVDGWYYSDKDGAKYEVTGKVGEPSHSIKFKVHWPRTVQEFQGWMFTGDGRAICGVSRMQERDAGFYALRLDQD